VLVHVQKIGIAIAHVKKSTLKLKVILQTEQQRAL